MLEKKLKLVHLQLTSRCNLKCSFCGQWGVNGFMKKESHKDISLSEWKKVIDSIERHCPDGLPQICVWGGEPLIYKDFDALMKYIRQKGFVIGLVTNGVLLREHAKTVEKYVSSLYVSLDGSEEIHERSRGVKGIYRKTLDGISSLKNPDLSKVCMCTINEYNYHFVTDFPLAAAKIGFDRILFQNIMFSTSKDIDEYKKWLKEDFGIEALHADSWLVDKFDDYIYKMPEVIRRLCDNIGQGKYPIETILYPFELTEQNVIDWFESPNGLPNMERECNYCYGPFWHLHVTASGDVHYCVDYDDFSAGNIKDEDVMDIFNNETSEKFRKGVIDGRNTMCKRCPWRFNTKFGLDEKGVSLK
jgi:MoaA/NifB/PqqE/SkfB family radical SAM enzyme